jgi:hypothetical protein
LKAERRAKQVNKTAVWNKGNAMLLTVDKVQTWPVWPL